ncbi:MAG: hypothetical protein AAFR79_06710 [Pseudomonadota bacterium]
MRALNLIVNLAISLFLAPTPGLLILMYANGGSEIPPAQGLAVLLVSAVAYWLWLLNRRDARDTRQAMDAASFKAASSRPAVTAVPGMAYQPPVEEDRAARRAAALALQSHEDIVDPVAAESRRDPAEVLIDRVADLRQLKRLVADQENRLIASYSRFVDRDEYGAAIYGDWAYEVDRFLMSSSFMSRTMNRHEAIATVTAEVETSMESARSRNLEPRRRRRFGDDTDAVRHLSPLDVHGWGWRSDARPARRDQPAPASRQNGCARADRGLCTDPGGARLDDPGHRFARRRCH